MARGNAARFARFARGLNTTDGPYGLKEGYVDDPSGLGSEARDLENVVSRHRGNVSRRDGCVALYSFVDTAEQFRDLSVIGQDATGFVIGSTTAGRIVALDEDETLTELVAPTVSGGWTFIAAPVVSTLGPAYGMNGVDTPHETDGTLAGTGNWTAVTSGTLPNGSLLAYHENEVFVSGVTAYPQRIYWSYPGDPCKWPAENVLDLDKGGAPVTALCSSGPDMLVFKERELWAIYDSETGANRKVADGVGTISPRSVVATEQGTFFLDPQQGVMVTDGGTVRPASLQLDRTFAAISYAFKATASATYFNGHYYLAVEDETQTRVVFDLDTQLGSWWKHTPPVECLAVWDNGTAPKLVGAVRAA